MLELGIGHASMKEEERGRRVVHMQGSDYSDGPRNLRQIRKEMGPLLPGTTFYFLVSACIF